ncbi:hypothetical protein KKC45_01650 [Patescibacteria group bacterium]|nr:hypothetical protein [Patescibacteria group bacterium]
MDSNLPTKKILGVIVILNVVALASYFYLFSDIKSKNEATSVLENILDGQIGRESELKLVGSNLKRTEKERAVIDSYFVQKGKSEVAGFVEVLESLAELAGVSLKVNSILLKKEDASDIVEEMKLELEISSYWEEANYFLGLLELLPYKITFNKAYIEKSKDSQWKSVFNIKVLKLSDN